jgi:hypothetical protein
MRISDFTIMFSLQDLLERQLHAEDSRSTDGHDEEEILTPPDTPPSNFMVCPNLGYVASTASLGAVLMDRDPNMVCAGLLILRLRDWESLPNRRSFVHPPRCLVWMPGLPLPDDGRESLLSQLRGVLEERP